MRKTLIFASLALVATTGTAALAAPDKPLNAAQTEKRTLCIVRAGEGQPYMVDTECEARIVRKSDKDGNLISFFYQDKGSLQEGQVAPDRAIRIDLSDDTCTGSEVITPSGNYSSNLKCSF